MCAQNAFRLHCSIMFISCSIQDFLVVTAFLISQPQPSCWRFRRPDSGRSTQSQIWKVAESSPCSLPSGCQSTPVGYHKGAPKHWRDSAQVTFKPWNAMDLRCPSGFNFWLAALHKLGELWSRNSGEMACCWAYPVGPAKHVLSLAACEHWLLFQRRKVIANVLTCLTEVYRLCVFALCLLLREASEWFRIVKIIGLFLLLAAWQQQLENISGEMEKGRLPAIKLSNQASQLMAWSRTSSLVRSGSIGRYYGKCNTCYEAKPHWHQPSRRKSRENNPMKSKILLQYNNILFLKFLGSLLSNLVAPWGWKVLEGLDMNTLEMNIWRIDHTVSAMSWKMILYWYTSPVDAVDIYNTTVDYHLLPRADALLAFFGLEYHKFPEVRSLIPL